MKKYSKEELTEIIKNHSLWLENVDGGERANLSYADLRYANLSSANLSSVNLRYADLSYADLSSADLSSADLRSANLSYADLSSADLSSADLRSADLSSADLRSADLSSADLSSADLRSANLSYAIAGNNREIKTLQLGKYYTVISLEKICVGCQAHDAKEWAAFDDREILKMDGRDGLAWWKQWKDVIMQVHATIPNLNPHD